MRFRYKLLLLTLALAAIVALAVFLSGRALIRQAASERVSERLERETLLLADQIARSGALFREAETGEPPRPGAEADAFADGAGQALGLRLTLVAPDGTVVGDSTATEEELLAGDNLADRPEIVAARERGIGTARRWSVAAGEEMQYVARRVDRGGRPAGLVRLALPVAEIDRIAAAHSARLATLALAGFALIAAGGYLAARRFSRPLEEMSRTADAIADGRHDLRVDYLSDDEMGRLGLALNRMTRTLTEQIRALSDEKHLRDSILGGMKEGILVVDSERKVLLCNHASRSILDIRIAEAAGRPLIEVVRDRAVVAAFDAALERGEEIRETARMTSGPERDFEIHVVPLEAGATHGPGAIGIFFDITRLMALESVRREFVANVSHELRTPLTSIKAFVETLLSGGIDDAENNRRFLEIVRKHAGRMEAILDDLTDLSLIETGAVTLETERLELGGVVAEILDSLRPRAARRGVTLEAKIPGGLALTADPRRLDQILVNLIDNGIKFNRDGGRVSVRAREARSEGMAVRVEIEDTGVGIPPDALEKVFNRFYRVDPAASREAGGTGLGLSIVKHLMRLHGGTVRAESASGSGSRFVLEFPL